MAAVLMGAKIKEHDRGLTRLLRRVRQLSDGWKVTIGVQGEGASAPHDGGSTNVELAAIHEFGAPAAGIPQRSFLRSTYDEDKKRWVGSLVTELEAVVDKDLDVRQALNIVGEEFRAAVIDKIRSNIPPPLTQASIDRKGGEATALIDTGQLLNSISVVVSKA